MPGPLDGLAPSQPPAFIDVDGVEVPVAVAAEVVRRCIVAITNLDYLVKKGFASEAELNEIREILSRDLDGSDGEDASADAPAE